MILQSLTNCREQSQYHLIWDSFVVDGRLSEPNLRELVSRHDPQEIRVQQVI